MFLLEAPMAVNKPTGDNSRKGAVKKRTQLKNPLTKTSTKRNKKGGQFMAVKKSAKKFKVYGARNNAARLSHGGYLRLRCLSDGVPRRPLHPARLTWGFF
jgi:hypothetical protein